MPRRGKSFGISPALQRQFDAAGLGRQFAMSRARALPIGSPPSKASKGESSSPLTSVFPTTKVIGPVGYGPGALPMASDTQGIVSAIGSTYWRCFLDIEPAAVIGEECTLYGAVLQMSSLAKTADGVNRPFELQIGWNPAAGTGASIPSEQAAIVIGEKLPITTAKSPIGSYRDWTAASSQLPGIDTGLATGGTFDDVTDFKYFHYEFFPEGDFFGATCQRQVTRPIFAPYVHRMTWGRRVQVALVTKVANSGAMNLGNDLFVYGHVAVSLLLGLQRSEQSFTSPESESDV